MRTQVAVSVLLVATVLVAMAPVPAGAEERFRARLQGFEEVPAVSTPGTGEFRAEISRDESSLDYRLTYTLEGSVQQAHIHLGQEDVNGGIVLFLCTNLTPPGGVPTPPTCPQSPGEVSGTLTAADVITQASQGISSGDFAEVLRAIRRGVTYANVHSGPNHPGGEIRGQIKRGGKDPDHD